MIKKTAKAADGTEIEITEGTHTVYRTTAGDTACFANDEDADPAQQAERRDHGTTTAEGEHPNTIGIRVKGQRAIHSIFATIEDAEDEIRRGIL
jgi:hypothetical protein